ncbi:MAG TPA: ATP-binding protein [Actinomycetes bacterium]|nr:ATP-binding protein [Actinomycetes bacterium]
MLGSGGPSREAVLRVLDDAPLAMAVLGADERVLYANPAFSRLTGRCRHQLEGCALDELTHPEDAEAASAARRPVSRGEVLTSSADARLVRPDGRVVWVSMSCSASDGGQLVVQLVDVTERKRVERELARSNAELSSFAYLAAHELKSPLQALTGFAALLDQVHGAALGPPGRDLIGWILDGADRMETLIDALLAYCLVDRSETVLAPVALGAVLHDALGQLGREVTARGAVVTTGPLPIVTGDPVQLGQLLQNLVANALKFVPDGRPPRVDVSAERGRDGWTVTVADNGIGVADRDRDRIFTMFARVHPRERYKGTGIGLAVCKRIVERRGGTIWVEPNPAGGSRFRFNLPDVVPPVSTRSAA